MTAEQLKDRIIRRANERVRVLLNTQGFAERDYEAPFLHSLVAAIIEIMLDPKLGPDHEADCRCEWCKVHA